MHIYILGRRDVILILILSHSLWFRFQFPVAEYIGNHVGSTYTGTWMRWARFGELTMSAGIFCLFVGELSIIVMIEHAQIMLMVSNHQK